MPFTRSKRNWIGSISESRANGPRKHIGKRLAGEIFVETLAADNEQQLQEVEEVGRCLRVARGSGVEHQPNDQRQQQVEANNYLVKNVRRILWGR